MPLARWIARCAALSAALALSGCPSLTVGPTPSIDRAANLEQSGDLAGAARVYEGLAAQNSGADRNGYLLRAAGAWLRARRIIGELRKRFGEFARPQEELDYIERLLKDY